MTAARDSSGAPRHARKHLTPEPCLAGTPETRRSFLCHSSAPVCKLIVRHGGGRAMAPGGTTNGDVPGSTGRRNDDIELALAASEGEREQLSHSPFAVSLLPCPGYRREGHDSPRKHEPLGLAVLRAAMISRCLDAGD